MLKMTPVFISIFFTLAHAMERDFSLSDIYAVHCSQILPENNIKYAGHRFTLKTVSKSGKFKSHFTHPRGSVLQTRITLHHCLGGVVPEVEHGCVGKSGIKSKSIIYKDKEMFAFIEPLTAFVGEAYGGQVTDFFSIDQHCYGAESVLILPGFRRQDFEAQNPNYKGRLILFNPYQENLMNLVSGVIMEKNGWTTEELLELAKAPLPENQIQKLFDEYKFKLLPPDSLINHNNTCFAGFENSTALMAKVIENCVFPDDRFYSLKPIHFWRQVHFARFFIKEIMESLDGRLNEEKAAFLIHWQQESEAWFKYVADEINLREIQGLSKMGGELQSIVESIKQKADPKHESIFGEDYGYFSENVEFISVADDRFVENFTKIRSFDKIHEFDPAQSHKLYDYLWSHGLREEANIYRTFQQFFLFRGYVLNNALFDEDHINRFLKHLRAVPPSPVVQEEFKWYLELLWAADDSHFSTKTLNFLNGHVGKEIRRHLWNDERELSFRDLIMMCSTTHLLAKEEQCTHGSSLKEKLMDYLIKNFVRFTPPQEIEQNESRQLQPSKFSKKEDEWEFYVFNYNSAEKCINMLEDIVDSESFPSVHPLFKRLVADGKVPTFEQLFYQMTDDKDLKAFSRVGDFMLFIWKEQGIRLNLHRIQLVLDLVRGNSPYHFELLTDTVSYSYFLNTIAVLNPSLSMPFLLKLIRTSNPLVVSLMQILGSRYFEHPLLLDYNA